MNGKAKAKTKTKRIGKKGFGSIMLDHLGKVEHATTVELAKLAGVEVKQAYSRLMFLQTQESAVTSVGKGDAKVWSLPGKKLPPAPVKPAAQTVSGASRAHGWKPDLQRFESFEGDVEVGDKLLVEYPEDWRHTMLCSVTRATGYFGQENLAQVWNLREHCFAVVDTVDFAKRGWKIVRVKGEKDLAKLTEAA